jgi:hypothetical protein
MKEKNKGDKPIRLIMHTYMEMSQGNSLYSYFKQMVSFFFYKIREKESRTVLCLGEGRVLTVWGRGRDARKRCRR